MPLLKLWNSLRGRSKKGNQTEAKQVSEPQGAKPKGGSGFGIFGGGPHAGLRKQVRSMAASSVLEISVEDGSRAIAVLETLAKTQEHVRYFGIDQFELAGGPVTLKQFHQTLRAKNIRPQLFPETIQRGLIRIAHTIGSVDLVLIAAPEDQWRNSATLPLIGRVSHPETVVLFLQGETWQTLQPEVQPCIRRAA